MMSPGTTSLFVLLVLLAPATNRDVLGSKVPRQLQNSHHQQHQRNNHRNISDLLDNLLRGYDNSVRPNFGGTPAVVEVDIMVRSMGPISEVDMTYSMDCYFRQSWVDRRLAFRGGDKETTLALSISMLERIWKPDTYFYNGKQSYLHTITTPNKFVRLYQDGRVLYSSRLTIKAGCPMNLEDFPMDIQRCPLKFGSFGYTTRDVLYRWNSARRVAIAEDMKLSQFDLITTPTANQTDALKSGRGRAAAVNVLKGASNEEDSSNNQKTAVSSSISEYSMLVVSFHLQRHMGNFLIQVYGPCVLLVVLSWVSFWLNREATADRVSLGITTVLTMTFLGLEARTDLPKVPYPTALDFFVFLSFAFIFATIIQFAVVHYFTKYGSGEVYFSSDLSTSGESSSEGEWEEGDAERSVSGGGGGRKLSGTSTPSGDANGRGDITRLEVIPLAPPSIYFHDRRSLFAQSQRHHRRFAAEGRFQNRVIATPPSVVLVPPQQGDAIGRRMPASSPSASPTLCCLVRGDRAAPIRDHPASIGRYDVPPGQSPTPGTAQLSPLPHMQQPLRRRLSDSIRERFHRRESAASAVATRGTKRRKKRTPRYNSVSKIDRASRVVFPLCFLAINLFYWYSYLSRSERMNSHAPRF